MTSHGTRYEEHAGLLARVLDRTGCVHATLTWRGKTLEVLDVPGGHVRGAVIEDPLLGPAHAIDHATTIDPRDPDANPRGRPPHRATTMSAIDWARPTQIPAISAPAKIPGGAAAPIMNVIALLAERAGVPALRYAGPYPTHALWRTLLRSFRTTGTEDAFTAGALERAARVARDEIAIDFVPAPHERVVIPRGLVELRDGVERVVLDGVAYIAGGSPARLVTEDGEARAEVWFGDAAWAHVVTLAVDGSVLEGPHAIPASRSYVIGQAFPAALRGALAELVAEAVPAPLAIAARSLIAARAIRWADLGARAAIHDDAGFAVHAALWDRIAPQGLAQLALALAEALAPIAAQVIVSEATPPG